MTWAEFMIWKTIGWLIYKWTVHQRTHNKKTDLLRQKKIQLIPSQQEFCMVSTKIWLGFNKSIIVLA